MRRFAVLCSTDKKARLRTIYVIGLAFLLFSVAFGVCVGSTGISLRELLRVMLEGDWSCGAARIFLYVRVPRVTAALLCGAGLSCAGAVIQATLSNRLASPGIIGVNSGAGLAVTVAAALGIYGGWRASLFAFVGAFLTVMLVCLLGSRYGTRSGTLILIGVAINSLCSAVSDAIVTFNPDLSLMTFDFRMGDFSSVTYQKIGGILLPVICSIVLLILYSKVLDVLSLGEQSARSLGMEPAIQRTVLLILCALLSGCAVSVAGLLSFVGLMVPHTIRRLARTGHFHLLCLCALYGAAFVSFCDTLSRVLFSPYEIPVGVIMAVMGAPFFLVILMRGKGDVRDA